ncbi:MAG: tetratricopeptide repeat protein [Acidobacteriota bacterium]|nr:tetratricopeptide repeat protein [Acidobacteriota bacterium]
MGRTFWVTGGLMLALAGCASRQHVARVNPPATYAVKQTMTRQVINAIDLGDGDIQIRQLRQALLGNPGDLNARLQLAERYRLAGAPELWIDHYRLAADRFPANGYVATLLAKALRDLGRGPEAMAVLVDFWNRHPNAAPEVLSALGILRDDAGDFAGAEQAYRQAIARAPQLAYLHNNLGYNLLLQGKGKAAVQEFEQALLIEPRSEFANNNLGLALLADWTDDNQPKEALLHWQSVSGPATAHNNLATVLIQQKRYPEARKELDIALSYGRNLPAALENLELVSKLDGKPAGPLPAHNSFWKRVTKVFIVSSHPDGALQSASQ